MATTLPTELNGFPVDAIRQKSNDGDFIVIVDRGASSPHRFVVATWWPALNDKWSWGHYYSKIEEAVAHYRSGTALHAADH